MGTIERNQPHPDAWPLENRYREGLQVRPFIDRKPKQYKPGGAANVEGWGAADNGFLPNLPQQQRRKHQHKNSQQAALAPFFQH